VQIVRQKPNSAPEMTGAKTCPVPTDISDNEAVYNGELRWHHEYNSSLLNKDEFFNLSLREEFR
jgi:hypothetical protein